MLPPQLQAAGGASRKGAKGFTHQAMAPLPPPTRPPALRTPWRKCTAPQSDRRGSRVVSLRRRRHRMLPPSGGGTPHRQRPPCNVPKGIFFFFFCNSLVGLLVLLRRRQRIHLATHHLLPSSRSTIGTAAEFSIFWGHPPPLPAARSARRGGD